MHKICGLGILIKNTLCESVRIRSFSGPYFPAFGRMRENTDRKNPKYELFSVIVAYNSLYQKVLRRKFATLINPFSINVPFIYPLETSENLRYSDVFRTYRSGTLVENGLILFSIARQ